MYRVATDLAMDGHEIDYVCSRSNGMPKAEERDGIRLHRLGGLFTTSFAFASRGRSLRDRADILVEEVVGGIRVPYLSAAYIDKPRVCFWYQRNDLLFRNQYGPAVGAVLSSLERLAAGLYTRSRILTCSEASRESLVEMGIPRENVRIYYPGVPDELFPMARENGHEREDLLLVIGKFRRYKCLHHAILVLARLQPLVSGRPIRLVIAGRKEDPKYERYMMELARSLGVEKRVAIETDIGEIRKAELLRRAKLLLIPSPLEGFGQTAIEASLFGVPVIGTTGVPREAIQDGITGYRVPFGDLDAFARVVHRLLEDPAELERLAMNGIHYAQSFTWGAMVQTVRSVLDDIGA